MNNTGNFLEFTYKNRNKNLLTGNALLISEIEKAKADWITAQQKLNYVTEVDQIDYAIYALEASEKRYEMLIRQAKKINLNLLEQEEQIMED
jgi:hypothetical protein